jgi:coenzyme Q-binding protein COQ10
MALRILAPPPTALARPLRPVTTTLTSRRPFIGNPRLRNRPGLKMFRANKVLPYSRIPLFEIIADINSYPEFVPYCSGARVLEWQEPDKYDQIWPTVAEMRVGWGGFDEVFTSRVRCQPPYSVEATSGSIDVGDGNPTASKVFQSMVTRWELKGFIGPGYHATQVNLRIDYIFTSPLYAAASAAVSGKVAKLMIEAFEKRAHEKLGGPQEEF